MHLFVVRSRVMDDFERRAWEDVQRRRERHLARRSRNLVPKPVRDRAARTARTAIGQVEELPGAVQAQQLAEGVAVGATEALARIARESLHTSRIISAYNKHAGPISTITDIRGLHLRTVDAVKPRLDAPYLLVGVTSGASAGFVISGGELAALFGGAGGGAAGAPAGGVGAIPGAGAGAAPGLATVAGAMVADAAVTAVAAMRLVFHTAAYYGFDVSRPEERLRALGVLNFATATDQAMKQRAYQDLNRLVRMIVRNATWKQLDDNVITKIVHRVFRLLAERLTKRKLAAALPVAGIVIGAGLNARTLSRVADGADLLYREHFLRERHGLGIPDADDQDHAAANDEFVDISLVDVIVEEIEATDVTSEAPPEFVLQFDPSEIEPLAARFAYADDAAAQAAGAAARARGFYADDELALVCAWKTPRSRPLVSDNSPDDIEAATRMALGAEAAESERVEALTSLRGVGLPSASALLHFAFPADYPILDVRALESLGVPGRSTYSTAFWQRYLAACRTLAATHAVTIRTLDKALWQYSKERAADD
jgi:EcsC protein family